MATTVYEKKREKPSSSSRRRHRRSDDDSQPDYPFDSSSDRRPRSSHRRSSRRGRSSSQETGDSDRDSKKKAKRKVTEEEIYEYMAKKAQKKATRVAKKLKTQTVSGYCNDSNPFGDSNLNEKFVWRKKIERDVIQGVPLDDYSVRAEKKKQKERMSEIEKVKKRREERAIEKAQREEEMMMLQRERARAEADDFEKKEEEFHFDQSKVRSRIRLVEGRTKPIDVLTKYLDESDEFDIELDEPYMVFKGLTVKDMEELHDDIKLHLDLDRATPTHVEYWEALMVVCEWELAEARKKDTIDRARVRGEQPPAELLAEERGLHSSIETDVRNFLEGKTHKDLVALQAQIESDMRSGKAKLVEYWEAILKRLHIYKAKACLKEIHAKILRRHLHRLELPVEGLKLKSEEEKTEEEEVEHEIEGTGGGVLQGTTSEVIICTLVAARDRAIESFGSSDDQYHTSKIVVYGSDQTRSTFKKACKLVGIRSSNIRLIPTTTKLNFALSPLDLRKAIEADVADGLIPLYLCITVGTTSTTAVDPLEDLVHVTTNYGLWVHVDAAYAGSACICPEFRHYLDGIERVDSLSLSPHKWLLSYLDCCCMWVKNPSLLVKSLSTNPEYLKNKISESNSVVDYKDWQIGTGRRFRSLCMWLMLQTNEVENLQAHTRSDIGLTRIFEGLVRSDWRFEIVVPVCFGLVCFRLKGYESRKNETLNKELLDQVNSTGQVYMTHTIAGGVYLLRFAIGSTHTQECHVVAAWKVFKEKANVVLLKNESNQVGYL